MYRILKNKENDFGGQWQTYVSQIHSEYHMKPCKFSQINPWLLSTALLMKVPTCPNTDLALLYKEPLVFTIHICDKVHIVCQRRHVSCIVKQYGLKGIQHSLPFF